MLRPRVFVHSILTSAALGCAIFVSTSSPAVAQTETVIHSFQSNVPDGLYPLGALVPDGAGALYGTANGGGKYRNGAVYKLSPPSTQGGAWKQNIIYSFMGNELGNEDGSYPTGSIVVSPRSGKIYGTTQSGGRYGGGTVYEVSPPTQAGSPWTETVLYDFVAISNGSGPYNGVIADVTGKLYGTTVGGGRYSAGNVFRLAPPAQLGGEWIESTLYSFQSPSGRSSSGPTGLTLDATGALYGAVAATPADSGGGVFQLSPPFSGKGAWTESILYAFSGSDGYFPAGGVIFDSSGSLYGSTLEGGSTFGGAVYKVSPPAAPGGVWTESVLYSFDQGSGDAFYPVGALAFDSAGSLYGTTEDGGANSCSIDYYCGTVYKVSPPSVQGGAWTEQVLHSFAGGDDGAWPGTPVVAVGMTIYGTTQEGGTGFCENEYGPAGCGTVFQITQ